MRMKQSDTLTFSIPIIEQPHGPSPVSKTRADPIPPAPFLHQPPNGPLPSLGGSISHRMTGGTPVNPVGGRITKMNVWFPFVFFRPARRPKYQAVSGTATY